MHNRRNIALFIVVWLVLGLWGDHPSYAFPNGNGPFFPFEQYALAPKECDLLAQEQNDDWPRDPTSRYGLRGSSPQPQLVIMASQDGGYSAQVLSATQEILVPITHVSGVFATRPPRGVQCRDINGDQQLDFVATLSQHGNGLGADAHDYVLFLSSSTGFRIWQVPTMGPGPEDLIQLVTSPTPLLVSTTWAHTRAITEEEGKQHSYWVYNLITFNGAELVLANHLDPRFPKWVWYTLQENHKPARSLSEQQKKKILDAQSQTSFFREIVFGELHEESRR